MAFDAFPIFDPRSIPARAEQAAPGRGKEIFERWRQRLFAYPWLRTAGGRYRDFWQCVRDALAVTLDELDVSLSSRDRDDLAHAFFELDPWPDVGDALEALRTAGLRLALLSNFTPAMLDALVGRAHLDGMFSELLSTDRASTFKPAPAAYELGESTLAVPRSELLFVAFAAWDAAGAKWFGYPTFWANRLRAPREHLGVVPDAEGHALDLLVAEAVRGADGAFAVREEAQRTDSD